MTVEQAKEYCKEKKYIGFEYENKAGGTIWFKHVRERWGAEWPDNDMYLLF